MTDIDDLIKEHCSKVVEWKELGEVCTISKGKQLNKSLLTDDGVYPAYNGGKTYSGKTNNYNVEANTIIVSQGGASAGFVNFVDTKFWANAHCYYLIPDEFQVNNRFLYHFSVYLFDISPEDQQKLRSWQQIAANVSGMLSPILGATLFGLLSFETFIVITFLTELIALFIVMMIDFNFISRNSSQSEQHVINDFSKVKLFDWLSQQTYLKSIVFLATVVSSVDIVVYIAVPIVILK